MPGGAARSRVGSRTSGVIYARVPQLRWAGIYHVTMFASRHPIGLTTNRTPFSQLSAGAALFSLYCRPEAALVRSHR